jgi:uncharacterized FlaG/YvyC family protein
MHSQKGFGAIEGLLIVVAVSVVGFAAWYVYDSGQKTNSIYDKSTNVDTPVKANKKQAASDAQSNPITQELIDNIADSIKSQNTAALEGYMKDTVTVVVAASEKGGSVTKAVAIKDLDYIKGATAPWDFNLSSETLESYANGGYKQYFTDNTIFGKSADGMVVAFGIDDNGDIDSIFMAVNENLLTE